MGTPAFDTHAIVCPTCSRPSHNIPNEQIEGLYTCPNCKTRIVVSWSGHFVCDPVRPRNDLVRALRRRGQPIARFVCNNIGVAPLVGLFGAIAVGGLVLASGFGQVPERPSGDRTERSATTELQSTSARDVPSS
ncbi:MAG: hypothetical protein ACFB9N_16585 [Geitlerinemataceae cyanobacterium]